MLQHLSWKKNEYLFKIRLIHLDDHLSELQICMSHLISDEVSPEILFKIISQYYLAFKNKKNSVYYPNGSEFKEYVVQTNIRSKNNLNNNIAFWEHYLKDATSLHFPERYHVKKGHTLNTCTLIIPDSLLDQLQAYCTSHRLFITDSLTAAVAVCLAPYLKNRNKMLMVNFVKSTRDTDLYDEAIGLFIRTDIIKINLNGSFDFLTLSRNVQKSIIETAVYQSCPIIVKLGCFLNNEWRKKRIVNTLGSCISWIYASMFPKYKLDHRVLRMFFRVFSAQNKYRFFIDINILNHDDVGFGSKKLFDSVSAE